MTCRELAEFLMQYLDGELPAEQHRTFEEHLALCPDCEHYLDSYRQTVALEKRCFECPEDDSLPGDVPEALVQAILAARGRSGERS